MIQLENDSYKTLTAVILHGILCGKLPYEFVERLEVVTEPAMIIDYLGFTVVRGARKCLIDATVEKITYDNQNMIIKIPKQMPTNLKGTVKEKINFSYSRLL